MMDKFAIFDYAEKGALADYEKACMMYKLFQDEKSKAVMDEAFATAHEIRRLHVAEIDKMKKAEKLQREQEQAEEHTQKQTVTSGRIVPPDEPQKATAEPLDYTVNIEYTSGRKVNFHLDDKDMARHAYDSAKTMAKRLPGIISRIVLVQHNTDKTETVLLSADIG